MGCLSWVFCGFFCWKTKNGQVTNASILTKLVHMWNIPLTPLRSKFRNFLCEFFKFLRLKNPPTKHDIFNKIRPFLIKESSQTMEKREHKNHFALCLSNDEFHILKENFIDSNMKYESAFLRIWLYTFLSMRLAIRILEILCYDW